MNTQRAILEGNTYLGIELGSTRIKAVLIDSSCQPIASGSHEWHDHLENGVWTYALEEACKGLQLCYQSLKKDVFNQYHVTLTSFSGIGISAMMHGYLIFDEKMNQLAPFRTWRNTITGEAAEQLTQLFHFNIPQRWSIAHLYQAILNQESHLSQARFMTTLAGYVHWLLTGEKVLGVGDASGMFPISEESGDYDAAMIAQFDTLIQDRRFPWRLQELLPKVLIAGEQAGRLTKEGALLLDPEGDLKAGIPLCPPEGDAGTGMAATNSVAPRTGNVSAGTSIFAMIVLEKALKQLHTEIDMVATPDGKPVAMVHCNTCTSDLNAWVGMFAELLLTFGCEYDPNTLYTKLFQKALEGETDCGGITAFNYYSGEPVTDTEMGAPLFTRKPEAPLTLANFMRTHLLSALATLAIGMKTLTEEEKVAVDSVCGHGGFFKTPEVGQRLLAAAINAPVTVMDTAGEGGAWGIAILAAYMRSEKETLADFLQSHVFARAKKLTVEPDSGDVLGFEKYLLRYKQLLPAEIVAASLD